MLVVSWKVTGYDIAANAWRPSCVGNVNGPRTEASNSQCPQKKAKNVKQIWTFWKRDFSKSSGQESPECSVCLDDLQIGALVPWQGGLEVGGLFLALRKRRSETHRNTGTVVVDSVEFMNFVAPRHWGLLTSCGWSKFSRGSKRIDREHQAKNRKRRKED